MIPIMASSTQTNLLIHVGGDGFVIIRKFFLWSITHVHFSKNSLIRNGLKEKDECPLIPKS